MRFDVSKLVVLSGTRLALCYNAPMLSKALFCY